MMPSIFKISTLALLAACLSSLSNATQVGLVKRAGGQEEGRDGHVSPQHGYQSLQYGMPQHGYQIPQYGMPQGGNAGQHGYQNPQYGMPQHGYQIPQYGMPQGGNAGQHGYQSPPYDASHGSPSRPGFVNRVAAKTGKFFGSRKAYITTSYMKVGLAGIASPVTNRMSAETKAHLREGIKGIKNDVIGSSSHLQGIQQSYVSAKRDKRGSYGAHYGGD